MDKITIIIPVNEFNDEIKKYLTNAILSFANNGKLNKSTATFVGTKEITAKCVELFNEVCPSSIMTVKSVINNKDGVFNQINAGVFACSTPYFSVLELDDRYSDRWFDKFDDFKNENDSISIYMPLNENEDTDGNTVSFRNEIAYAESFNDELGYIDSSALDDFVDFNLTGAIIKTDDFVKLGGLKESLKIASWYEYMERTLYNNKTIFVVPHVGYYHTFGRSNSFSEKMKETLKDGEVKWLFQTAKEEFYFKEDRNRKFGEEGDGING